jgi:archaellum component FlaC
MYTRFGKMSHDMREMTVAVTNMEQNIRGIPYISTSMNNMNANVNGMKNNVNTMTNKIVGIDQNMGIINSGVFEMSNRFEHLSFTVHNMGYNVNQMSRPIHSSPFYP